MRVTSKKVTRYVNGKGYASKAAAYQALAKQNVVEAAREEAGQFEGGVCEAGACPLRDHFGRSTCRCRDDETGEAYKSYCNRKRWDWIKARAKQMREEDEAGVGK